MSAASETIDKSPTAERGIWRRLLDWGRRVGLGGKLAIALAVVAVVSVGFTYFALTSNPFDFKGQAVLPLMLINLVLLLALLAVIARRLVKLWAARRSGLAGSGLHTRLVALFSLVAIAPTILVAIFSALFFQLGVQVWFSDQVRGVLDNSLTVAESYVGEHRKVIRADILAMANDLNRQAPYLIQNSKRLEQVVTGQAALRSLSEAVVFDSTGRVLAKANLSFSLGTDRLPTSVLRQAAGGEVVVLANNDDDRVSALIRLDRFFDTYLYINRFMDPKVLAYAANARATVNNYEQLESNLGQKQTIFNLIYIVLALLVLLAAVWAGLSLATRLVAPISGMVVAAERLRQGDLSARVDESGAEDELGVLSRAFNRMTRQLHNQREDLMKANRQLDSRRRFSETVLAGVTAGIIGLDKQGRVNLSNRSADEMLGLEGGALVGCKLAEAVPEMAPLVAQSRTRKGGRVAQAQVNLEADGRNRNLLVRISPESFAGEGGGLVVTFDDITDLMAAQRTAAWADIARRIAHEIKNPLTPIQLSAERLKRKYGNEIASDPAVFTQCTDTIVRHVGDIRRMVDEFSSFARMPAPIFKHCDMRDIVRQAVFLQQVAATEVHFDTDLPSRPVMLECDDRQIAQAITNVVKNALESIECRRETADSDVYQGRIGVSLEVDDNGAVIEVADNGCGLPDALRDRLTEPYVTTREKGTGLGLAIVQKVMRDHGGTLSTDNGDNGGAVVRLQMGPGGSAQGPDSADDQDDRRQSAIL